MEEWLHQIAGNVLNRRSRTRSDLEDYQLLRLRQTLRHAYEKSSFYRESFDRIGFRPEDLRSLEDLSRLPLTEPQSLSESPYRFLCISQAEIARPHSFVTSGTSGPQKKVFWTAGDLERIIQFMAAGIATVANDDDVVQILLADGRPYSQADLLHRGVKAMGATSVITGMDAGADEQLQILESSHSTILFGYTGQIFRLSKELQAKTDLGAKGVRVLFLAGEYVPFAMRKELEKLWRCRVYTHYGLTEMGLGVAVECEAHAGYHFNEAALLLEIVNPQTGEPVPPGTEGELIFTTLTREAIPLLRYRTHDISRLILEPCPCGAATLLRFDFVRKRLESTLAIEEGGEIYPSLLDDVLYQIPGLVDYQAALTRAAGETRLEINAEVLSPATDTMAAIRRALESVPVIASEMARGRMPAPQVSLVAAGSLRSVSRAKKLIKTP